MAATPASFDDPAWLQEFDVSLGVSSQFILGGNVADLVLIRGQDGNPTRRSGVREALWERLKPRDFSFLATYDLTAPLTFYPDKGEEGASARTAAGDVLGDLAGSEELTLDMLAEVIEKIARSATHRGTLLVQRAGRLALSVKELNPIEHTFFARVARIATTVEPRGLADSDQQPVFNPVIWLVENERELPDWFLNLGERLRTASIPAPKMDERKIMAERLFPVADEETAEAHADLLGRFAGHAHGMTLRDMQSIRQLAYDRGVGLEEIEDAVRGYRVGVLDNPWKQSGLRKDVARELDELKKPLEDRDKKSVTHQVLGQENAVRRALDVLARSVTGMTAAHRASHSMGPRGILFLAGPTGVGKTELAKTLTELVFGDISAYTRFDMSEFSEDSSAARLIGAPPSYIGFDAGGELTNAIRERPFSLVLFDEIDKASNLIFDKFLQILEDGRLTDGRGGTVTFTESILVFTSNLGILRLERQPDGSVERVPNVSPEIARADPVKAERMVRAEIDRFFVDTLGRPELRNRFGDNIIVFDYIDRHFGGMILEKMTENVAGRVRREQRAEFALSAEAREQLAEIALSDESLANGGRGIGSAVEAALVNPLSRELISSDRQFGDTVTVTEIRRTGRTYEVGLA